VTASGKRWGALAVFLIVCVAGGALGGIVTVPAIDGWYRTIQKPAWTPPDGLFGPVWTVLYVTIAIAGWLVWRHRSAPGGGAAMTLWCVQLALNLAWSPLFFGLRSPGLGLVDIVLLWAAIVAFLWAARRIAPAAALLLVPYLAWVSFATALNLAIFRLNAVGPTT